MAGLGGLYETRTVLFAPVLMVLAGVLAMTPMCAGQVWYSVSEAAAVGHEVGSVLSRSGLTDQYNTSVIRRLRYTLMSRGSLPTDYFTINSTTSTLTVARQIDRDILCDLLMICCDSKRECVIPLSIFVQPTNGDFFIETINVNVKILDENDHDPEFSSARIEGHITEVASIGSTVTLAGSGDSLIALDADAGDNGVNKYSIISPGETFGLRVEEDYGVVTDVAIVTLKELDRETVPRYEVVVLAQDGGRPPRSGSITVQIQVSDFNDHAPQFENDTYTVWLSETAPVDSRVLAVLATDQDSGVNANINYVIRNRPSDIVSRLFTVNSVTGEIRTKGRLNFEDRSSYRIIVEASDEGTFIQRKSRTIVVVNLEPVNDHGPVIQPSYLGKHDRAEVLESARIGTFVALVSATDPDDDKIDCSITNPMFTLTRSQKYENQFHLVTAHTLNRELSGEYEVTVTCTDRGIPQMQTSETFPVHVLDANDNKPRFTQSTYSASLTENNEEDVFVLQVTAHDLDSGENAKIIYSLDQNGEEQFSINSNTGRIYTKHVFDREDYDLVRFKVRARDNGSEPLYTEANIILRISDANDNAPTFHGPNNFEISEAAGPGVLLGELSATDPDVGQNAEIFYDVKPTADAGSFLVTRTGLITTLVQLDREKQSEYRLVVLAHDNGQETVHSCSTTVTILVTDVNDCSPRVHFPNAYNNTVYISYLEPVGQAVVYVNASDADLGRNALLDYSFTHGNELGMFRINAQTGAIHVAKKIQKVDALVYKLGIRVQDRAEPYNSVVEILNIVVDGTGKAIAIDGTYLDNIVTNRNLIIVICLGGISGILAIILVVAIICIRRVDRNHAVTTETVKVYEHRNGSADHKDHKYQPGRQRDLGYSTEVDDSNGHSIYSSLKPPTTWKSSVYPKALEVIFVKMVSSSRQSYGTSLPHLLKYETKAPHGTSLPHLSNTKQRHHTS